MTRYILISLLSLSLFIITGCDTVETEAKYPTSTNREGGIDGNSIYEKPGNVFGESGMFGQGKKDKDNNAGVGISVNAFLWRASLDTVSFMPLTSADPFGGTILTDWHAPNGIENERFKLNVFILTRELRSDGIRVRVFRQNLIKGNWIDSNIADNTARQLEDTILTRARQLRVAQSGK